MLLFKPTDQIQKSLLLYSTLSTISRGGGGNEHNSTSYCYKLLKVFYSCFSFGACPIKSLSVGLNQQYPNLLLGMDINLSLIILSLTTEFDIFSNVFLF